MILLDTHIVIWLAFEPDKLSKRAKEAIAAARLQGGLAIAGITLLELAWLGEKRAGRNHSQRRILRSPVRFQNDGATYYAGDCRARRQLAGFVSEKSSGPVDGSDGPCRRNGPGRA
jgi:predicted nucleic acid-binding protein